MEEARPATVEDEPRLRELAEEFVRGLLDQRGGRLLLEGDRSDGPGDLGDRLAAGVDAPGRVVLVGTLDGTVTGFAGGRVVERVDGARRGVLEGCYVEPGARGVGLGHLMLEAVLRWFDAQDVDGVDGTALPGDRQAKNFFESAGFKARMLTMHRPHR